MTRHFSPRAAGCLETRPHGTWPTKVWTLISRRGLTGVLEADGERLRQTEAGGHRDGARRCVALQVPLLIPLHPAPTPLDVPLAGSARPMYSRTVQCCTVAQLCVDGDLVSRSRSQIRGGRFIQYIHAIVSALRVVDVRRSDAGLHVTLAKEKTMHCATVSRVVTPSLTRASLGWTRCSSGGSLCVGRLMMRPPTMRCPVSAASRRRRWIPGSSLSWITLVSARLVARCGAVTACARALPRPLTRLACPSRASATWAAGRDTTYKASAGAGSPRAGKRTREP